MANQRAKFKQAWQALTDRVEGLEKANKALETQNAELKTKADDSEVVKRLEATTGELRLLKTRVAFNTIATEKGANPKLLADLWKLTGVTADKDDPDLAALGKLIDEQKTERGLYFQAETPPPAEGAAGNGEPPPPKPGPAGGQGGPGAKPGVQFSIEQLQDPKFVMMNFDRISKAAQERVARGEV
jgi:hypothetical protein